MSQVTEQSVRFQTALASIKLIQGSAVLELTDADFDFLTSNKVWIATDRSRARRCVEACVYGTRDFVGYPRFPAPVEFIAAVLAYSFHHGPAGRAHVRAEHQGVHEDGRLDDPRGVGRARGGHPRASRAPKPGADASPSGHPGVRADARRGQGDPGPPARLPRLQRRLRR